MNKSLDKVKIKQFAQATAVPIRYSELITSISPNKFAE